MSEKQRTYRNYTVVAKLGPKEYTAKGESLRDALDNLTLGEVARDKVIIIAKRGKKTQERVFPPFIANRMFKSSPNVQEMTKKNVAARFEV